MSGLLDKYLKSAAFNRFYKKGEKINKVLLQSLLAEKY